MIRRTLAQVRAVHNAMPILTESGAYPGKWNAPGISCRDQGCGCTQSRDSKNFSNSFSAKSAAWRGAAAGSQSVEGVLVAVGDGAISSTECHQCPSTPQIAGFVS